MLYYACARARVCMLLRFISAPLNVWATAGEHNAILSFLDPGLSEFVSVLISKSLA